MGALRSLAFLHCLFWVMVMLCFKGFAQFEIQSPSGNHACWARDVEREWKDIKTTLDVKTVGARIVISKYWVPDLLGLHIFLIPICKLPLPF